MTTTNRDANYPERRIVLAIEALSLALQAVASSETDQAKMQLNSSLSNIQEALSLI